MPTKAEPSEKKYRLDPDKAAIIRPTPPVVMDVKEASAYLVCSPRKLRDLIASSRVTLIGKVADLRHLSLCVY